MTRLLFSTIAATLIATPLLASPSTSFERDEQECSTFGLVASVIMTLRQTDIRLDDAMRMMTNSLIREGNDHYVDSAKILVVAAYREPVDRDEDEKVRIIHEFGNKTQVACLTAALHGEEVRPF